MSEELADSIVRALQKMHQKESLREMVALYVEVKRTGCQGKSTNYQCIPETLSTSYQFKNKKVAEMDKILKYAAQQGYALFRYFDEEKIESRICRHDGDWKTYYEKKIIALYKRMD